MIALFALLAGQPSAVPPALTVPLSVPDLMRRHDEFVGRRVRLRGWLPRDCVHLECAVYAQRNAEPAARVSIGAAPMFDAAVHAAVGHEVVIEATVSANCWPSGGVRCSDRGDQLVDPRLVRVLD